MSFSAQFRPQDVEHFVAHTDTGPAEDQPAFYLGLSLANGDHVTLCNDFGIGAGGIEAMRDLLRTMLRILDQLDPADGNQKRARVAWPPARRAEQEWKERSS